tara:strand:- start:170 stop:658 length:489 start_codon:yes stop_codon:yes gene_type:complete
MFKYFNILSFFTDILIKLFLGIVFFNYGYVKLTNMINSDSLILIDMVQKIPFFGLFPVFFSWVLALSETMIIFGLLYGIFSFLPYSSIVSRITGLVCLFLSLIILYQHIFIWGDNIFSYGPFKFMNVNEEGKTVLGQFLIVPLSLYVTFHSRQSIFLINDGK